MGNRICLYKEISKDIYCGAIFIDSIVKYVGYLTCNRLPSNGLTINVLNKNASNSSYLTDSDLNGFPKLSIMNLKYLLEQLEIDSIDDLRSGQQVEKRSEGQVIYYLTCETAFFQQSIECYFFELCQILTQVHQSIFTYFIGEYEEYKCSVRERNGLKTIDRNSYYGTLPLDFKMFIPVTFGCLVLPDRRYKGYTVGGEPNGMGHVSHNNENQFVGYSCKGLMSFGCYFLDLNYNIVSVWEKRDRRGYTIEQYGDGVVYFGQISKGKKNGLGVIMMANGSVIMGCWMDNKVHGMILSFSHVATVFSGNVSDESFNGYGEMFYKNRSYYYGNWDRGQYHEHGVLVDQHRPKGDNRVHYWNHGMIYKNSPIANNEVGNRDSEDSSNSHSDIRSTRNPWNQQQTLQ